MFEERVAVDVARVLTVMVSPPNPRRSPFEDDLNWKFDIWFDGGAVKLEITSTGSSNTGNRRHELAFP